jgi:serine/threonine protein phosphatase PrpC
VNFKNIILFISLAIYGVYASEVSIDSNKIRVGWATHIGTRPKQEDRAIHKVFKIKDINYDLAIVCDGHGGDTVSQYVINSLPTILQQKLQNNAPKTALLEAFAKCEKNIRQTQNCEVLQPGTTVVVSLWDMVNKKRWVANLGDCRLYDFSAENGAVLWQTKDHLFTDEKEKCYIEKHGGIIKDCEIGFGKTQRGIVREDRTDLGGLETPRALGDSHLKVLKKESNTFGPINPIPKIYETEIPQGYIEVLVTDGFTKTVDDKSRQSTLLECWNNILTLSDDEFANTYAMMQDIKEEGKFVPKNHSLTVAPCDMQGDEKLKKISSRIIYILRYLNENFGGMDNVTVFLRQLAMDPTKSEVKSSNHYFFNKCINRYSLVYLLTIISLWYCFYYYQ